MVAGGSRIALYPDGDSRVEAPAFYSHSMVAGGFDEMS